MQTSNMKIHFGVHSYKVNHLTMMHNTECKNQNKDFITSIHKIIPPPLFFICSYEMNHLKQIRNSDDPVYGTD